MLINNKLVSIIVPVYNVENYIERCIESIMNQTYKDLEIILVDDGSKDQSGMICDRYKLMDNRINVIHKVNGGLSDARNVGLSIASGKYISFVDSDDWIEDHMIEVLLNNIIEADADIAIGRRFRAYQDGSRILEKFKTYPKEKIFDSVEGLGYLMSFCGYDMSVCDKLFASHVLNDISFPFGKTCEDSFTTYKIFAQAKTIVYINEGLYNYFFRENSISRNSNVNETVIEATFEQLKFVKESYPQLLPEASSAYITALVSVQNEYIKRNKKWNKYALYKKEAQKYLKLSLCNDNISSMKKIQLLLFSISGGLYKLLFALLKKNK